MWDVSGISESLNYGEVNRMNSPVISSGFGMTQCTNIRSLRLPQKPTFSCVITLHIINSIFSLIASGWIFLFIFLFFF